MVSKLDAVKLATAAGIPTVIANGRRAGIIPRIAAGERVGTRLPAQKGKSDGGSFLSGEKRVESSSEHFSPAFVLDDLSNEALECGERARAPPRPLSRLSTP